MNPSSNKPKILAIVGATASGKSSLAVETAKKLDGEIVSADSRLVYKDFNIGTAKPSPEEMQGIPHYMIDIISPAETYTAGKYKIEAEEKIRQIQSKNKLPIIVGGTGFYIKSLLEGLDIPDVNPDEDFRLKMQKFVETQGKEALYKKLQQSDPIMAEKLMQNDSFRIIRALEVQHVTGQKMSDIQTLSEPQYDVLYIGLNSEDREYLYKRINDRVLSMLDNGLIHEVENLINKYGKTVSIMKTLGYREISEYLEGLYSLDEAVSLIQQNTRNFAKRQLTWFRANKNINWFFIDKMDNDEIVSQIFKKYKTVIPNQVRNLTNYTRMS